ncbi:unnamed protein product [Schistosoma haematobium]|nr:unnamed protein product [Schistosoma haematobium]
MDSNLNRSENSDIENIDELPEENNEFETLKVLQQSSTSKESIQQKSSKYKKYTNWICNCNRTITKQCIKRQFSRSKTTIEEHICYPWLRRLFFHLSNYFPNLHTTRSSRNYRSQTSTSSSSTVINRRQNNKLPLNKNINTYIYKSPTRLYKENDSQQLYKHNTIECINSITRMSMNDLNSSDTSYLAEDNHDDIKNDTSNNMNNRFKRRPLQRQKSNGFIDLDIEPEINLRDRLTSNSSFENNNLNIQIGKLITPKTESIIQPIQHYQSNDDLIHVKQNNSLYNNNRLQETHNILSPSSSSSSLIIDKINKSQLIKPVLCNNYPSTRIKSHHNLQIINNEQNMIKSSDIHLNDNIIKSINRRAYMTRSTNLIYDTLDEPIDNYNINDQNKTILSASTRIYNDNNINNNLGYNDIPENQYCIQFKRVKARRTSSSSQNDCNKIIKNRTFNKEYSIHDNNLQSKLYTSNRINDKLIQSNLYCTLNDLPHDQEPVKKHLESWLKETVTRTIQGKALNNRTRRIHMSHVSSGEEQREPPETVTPQPHSFDGPVTRYHDECLFTTSYSQQSIQKPFNRSLNISTDSSQIKPPSITRDSIDGYLPYYYETVFEKHPEINDHHNINKTGEKINLSSSNRNKLYRRNSINPMFDINNKNLKSTQRSSFSQHRNFTIINPNNNNNNQITNDYTDHTLPLIINNDRLQINRVSYERANSPKESDRIKEEYLYQYNQSDIYNNKPIVHNTNNVNDNNLSYYCANITSQNTERLCNTINPNQRYSFNEKVKLSRSPNVTSLPEKYRLTHTLSDENRNKMIFTTMSPVNTSQSLRKLVNIKKSPQTSIDNTGQHVNYELYRRGSKYSHILDPSLSMDCSVSHQPHQGMYSERRYSRHLKPLDAWQNRQSHSMEIVYSTPSNQRSLSSPQKRSPLSKQSAIRKLPAIYSRSLQHSTCSFPVQWGGFLSGPTLSLTSAFDSSSLTPDSLNHRQFFRNSLDSHEPTQLISGIQHQQYHHRSQNSYKDKFFISQDHTYSATESPKNLNPLKENINNSRNIKSLQQSHINLSPWPYNAHSVTRKVHSFELNPNIHCQQQQQQSSLSSDSIKNTTILLKVKDNLSLPQSNSSSRRGSANSNNSVFILKELKSKLNNDKLPNNDFIPNNNNNCTDNTILNSSSLLQNYKTKPLEKLIPPDLIFSPASRRASMMDEDISSNVQNSILNITDDLHEVHSNHNNNNNNKLMPTNLFEFNHSNSLSYQNLKYNRHKSADTYLSSNKLNNLHNFYSHRNSTNVPQQYNNNYYYIPLNQQNITPPPHSPLLINNNNNNNNYFCNNEDDYVNYPYQSHIHVTTCCSQIDMRNIQNEWDFRYNKNQKQLNNYNSDYNLTNHYKDNNNYYCINKNRTSIKQIQSISDEEYTNHKSLIKTKMKTLKGKDYLFKSTRGSDTNIIDPQLLKPSLGPVIDSSDENTSDNNNNNYDDNDDDDEGVERSQSISIPSSITNSLQSSIYYKDKKSNKTKDINHKQTKTDSHAARRKSFLANYCQQTIQQDDEQSNEDIKFNTNESDNEFNITKIKSNRYESTSGLNNYKVRYHTEDNNDNVNNRDLTLLQINRSINTRCKSSDSGLNYMNNLISSNKDYKNLSNTRELPSIHQQQKHHHQDYHSIKRKSRRKSKYH